MNTYRILLGRAPITLVRADNAREARRRARAELGKTNPRLRVEVAR